MKGLYGVIGDPIAHSLSPLIHKSWMREHQIDCEYLAFQVPEDGLKDALDLLAARGLQGTNITLPHKVTALNLSRSITPRAKAIGAANTLRYEKDGWHADNTDAPGFQQALGRAFNDKSIERETAKPALVLGAGGAARAVAYVFGQEQQQAVFCNRTLAKAEALQSVFDMSFMPIDGDMSRRACDLAQVRQELETCAFMVNTTSLGHAGKSLDWPAGHGRLVYDLSYGRVAESFLGPAREAGWQTVDGLGMLAAQAAFAFEIWFGITPNIESALARCLRTLEGE